MLINLTHDELRALQARLAHPLPQTDADEADLSPAIQAYRVQENHYRSAVEKIKWAIDAPTGREKALDDLPPIIRELVESNLVSLFLATKIYREENRDENKAYLALANAMQVARLVRDAGRDIDET